MGPTIETRSRDEWLAEVKRRGGRLRRRRRVGFGAVAALALVLPASVTAGVLTAGSERAVELSVAGPAPMGGMAPLPAPPNELATGEVPQVATTPEVAPTTTVAEVHERVATINGVPGPRSSPTAPPADEPVVGRSTATTIAPSGSTGSPSQDGTLSASTSSASPGPAPAPCVADEFRLTVTMEKSAFGPGERVEGSSVLEKRSPGTCLLPNWSIQASLLNGAGMDVSPKARGYGLSSTFNQAKDSDGPCGENCRGAVEPGAVFTHTFYWEPIDCTNVPPVRPVPPDDSHCVPFPPGTYQVFADWSGPGSGPPASATFTIGA